MTQADDRLKALFAEDEPPARDAAFSMAVMERLMRRRFFEDVAILSGVSAVGGAVLWPLWPVLQPTLVHVSQGFAPALGVVALALSAVMILGGRARVAVGLS
jgi:hypothetical protein